MSTRKSRPVTPSVRVQTLLTPELARLLAAGDYEAAGTEASRISAQVGKRCDPPPRGPRPRRDKHADSLRPHDARSFLKAAGMRNIEWAVGEHAREVAIRVEREMWLPRLERMLEESKGEHPMVLSFLAIEIERLRRCLGLTSSTPDEKRAQTRERVRRFRERKAAAK